MASFGRKPIKASGKSVSSAEAFRRLQEEEEERERFAKEFERNGEQQRREEEAKKEEEKQSAKEAEKLIEKRKGQPNPVVYLDVELRGRADFSGRPGKVEATGRLEIELYADVVPKTAENFRCLCTGEKGKDLSFRGSSFHRIIPGFMAQGGDITNGDGTGGRSIYGPTFPDENFSRVHLRGNLLSMANSGPNTNNSQFFILFKQAKHLDRKHVVFGEIIREDGQVMKRMEAMGSDSGDVKGVIAIKDCGEVRSADDEQRSRERFRKSSRSRTRSAERRKKQRRCYI